MGIKQGFKLILIHFFLFILGFVLFLISFRTPIFASMDVLFYRGILLLFVICIFVAILIFFLKKYTFKDILTYRDLVLSITLIFSFNMLFFTHLPITADRSVTVFLLGYMNNNATKTITEDEMNSFFIEKYVYSYGAMDRRVHEQITSGNLVKEENGYRITSKGRLLMKLYAVIADIFDLDKKFISPR